MRKPEEVTIEIDGTAVIVSKTDNVKVNLVRPSGIDKNMVFAKVQSALNDWLAEAPIWQQVIERCDLEEDERSWALTKTWPVVTTKIS